LIADQYNHRIVEWKSGAASGLVVAGGNGQRERNDQLNRPTDVIVDKGTDSFIISDDGNRRVIQWYRGSPTIGQTIIKNIDCCGFTMDGMGFFYVPDVDEHVVRRYEFGETGGVTVAGGNGQGDRLNQLNHPRYVFVDQNHSVYVSDWNNNRVMKWIQGAEEGIVVAGGQGYGSDFKQLSNPRGVFVDQRGILYVADWGNHRVVRWCDRSTQGDVIAGGNGPGQQANQLNEPTNLSFDQHGNLYVVDYCNHRIQRFSINTN
jgi:hypothetical protein